MKVYRRTENGTTTHVPVREALDEVNQAMMGRIVRERRVRTMSSSRGRHHIEYADGRTVDLVLTTAPAEITPETDSQGRRIVTVKGKRYIVSAITPARPRTPGATSWTPHAYVSYWSERNGQTYGATRSAGENAREGTVARAIWDAVGQ